MNYKVGERVKAFHPHTLGVVHVGTIVKIGYKWIHIDFGSLRGGIFKIRPSDIVEVI